MSTRWREQGEPRSVIAPVSLIVSAFAPVRDARRTLTPVLQRDRGASTLLLIDLSHGRNRLGMSALAQVFSLIGGESADLDDAAVTACSSRRRSSSCARAACCWPITTAPTAACWSRWWRWHSPATAASSSSCRSPMGSALAHLFTEEPGVVLQVASADQSGGACLPRGAWSCGRTRSVLAARDEAMRVRIRSGGGTPLLDESWSDLRGAWSETSYRMRRLRDEPQCAEEEFAALLDAADPGLSQRLSFDPQA